MGSSHGRLAEVAQFAERIAPTLLEPLKTRSELRKQIDLDPIWQYLVEEPIGKVITQRFSNDVVRGVVLTDALIGTFASAFDIQANICFLYHLIGNGTGEWKVPKGGMGALVNELLRVATQSGVEISLNSKAIKVESSSMSNLKMVSLYQPNTFFQMLLHKFWPSYEEHLLLRALMVHK